MPRGLKVAGGSLIGLLTVAALLVWASYWRHTRKVAREIDELFAAQPPAAATLVTEEMLAPLPAPMQRYLHYSGVVGKPMIHTVRLKQAGRFRTGVDQPWMDFTAEQYYTVDKPGFVWATVMRVRGLPLMIGRDRYQDATGNMLITLGSVIKVVDSSGPNMDQGTMLRYLNEMMWFPTAFLNDYVSYTPVNHNTVVVTYTDQGKSVSATLTIDEEGKLTNSVAERYYSAGDTFYRWKTPLADHGEIAGLRLPQAGQGVWELPEGDFTYIDPKLTGLEFNVAQRY